MLINKLIRIEGINGFYDIRLGRMFNILKLWDILNTKSFKFENKVGEIYSRNFRRHSLRHILESIFGKDSVADTIVYPSCPSSPLLTTIFPTWYNNHFLPSRELVTNFTLHIPTINNVLNIRNGNRTFGNIRRKNDLPIDTLLKYFILLLRW